MATTTTHPAPVARVLELVQQTGLSAHTNEWGKVSQIVRIAAFEFRIPAVKLQRRIDALGA